jgi:hypothetical protein
VATGREVVDAVSACTTGVEADSPSPEGPRLLAIVPQIAAMIPNGDMKKNRI